MVNIATTLDIEKKKAILEKKKISTNFGAGSIDIWKDYSTSQKNRKVSSDGVKGYKRLIENSHYAQKQVNWLRQKIRQHPYSIVRFLVRLPQKFRKYDALRGVLYRIQEEVGIASPCIPMQKDETLDAFKRYFESMKKDKKHFRPVFDIEMPYEAFKKAFEWALLNFDEVILLNEDFEGNEEKFGLTMKLSGKHPEKLHLAGAYWSIGYGEPKPMLATLMLCSGFKSVSFQPAPIPPYLFKHMRGKVAKPIDEKMKAALWIDDEHMKYVSTHPATCNCFDDNIDITKLAQDIDDIRPCVYHHDLIKLSSRYALIKSDKVEKERVLNLPVFEPLLRKMR